MRSAKILFLFVLLANSAFGQLELSKVKPFIERLRSASLVTIQYDKLVKDIDDRKLEKALDILNYFDKAVIINVSDYPDDPEYYLEAIHRKTSSVLPDLTFTDFSFKIVTNPIFVDSVARDFICSFQSHGRLYRLRSSIEDSRRFGQTYIRIFNMILTDIRSPYRLHLMMDPKRLNSTNLIGIAAMTEQQTNKLRLNLVDFRVPPDAYLVPSGASYSDLRSDQVEKAIADYRSIGLFDHLSQQQIAKATDEALATDHSGTDFLTWFFPGVIYQYNTEFSNLRDPYGELVRDFSKITHGVFAPTNISDDFSDHGQQATVRFNMNGTNYEKSFEIREDQFDPSFLDFMNSVARDTGNEGRFFVFDEDGGVIYLTPAQHKFLQDSKLMSFSE